MKSRKTFFPYILISPLAIIMSVFIFYPVVIAIIESFKSINMLKPLDIRFVGFSNYIELFKDPVVLHTIKNSSLYYIFAVFIEVIGGMVIALVLKDKFKGRGILLAIVILPWALPPVVNGLIWKWIYHPSYGLLNDILYKLGVINEFQIWFKKSNLSIFFVTIVHAWKMIPLAAVIILAQLQTISKEVYEAAKIDGANKLQLLKFITLPMLKPALIIVLTQATIASFQLFDEIYVLTGTDLDTRSLYIQNYLTAFRNFKLSLGMALSFIITAIILVITFIYMLLQKEAKEV